MIATSRSWRDFVSSASIQWALIPLFTLLTALGAFLKWPLPGNPVPVTLQTFFVLLAGMSLGASRGAFSQFLFLALSAAGLPWLAGPSIVGPTAGYVVGFIVAAFIMGYRSQPQQKLSLFLFRAFAAETVIFSLGVLWLCFSLSLSLTEALTIGLLPFIVGEIFKVSALTSLYIATRRG